MIRSVFPENFEVSIAATVVGDAATGFATVVVGFVVAACFLTAFLVVFVREADQALG
jgi:hypothetical protein